MRRVLVTRPEPGAGATARRLADAGYEPVVLPLTETRPVHVDQLPDPVEFDAVVATSSAAIRHAPVELLRAFSRTRLFAVGYRSAEAALLAGFGEVEAGGGDADALAGHIVRMIPKGSRLLYLCGRLRTGALAERLRGAGYAVTVLEIYDTVAVEQARDAAIAAFGGKPVDAALVYSAYGAAMLSQVAARPELTEFLATMRLLCISERAADALAPDLRTRAEIAQAPDEKELFRLLGAEK
jgi:uroporphyrinogen-III synthase